MEGPKLADVSSMFTTDEFLSSNLKKWPIKTRSPTSPTGNQSLLTIVMLDSAWRVKRRSWRTQRAAAAGTNERRFICSIWLVDFKYIYFYCAAMIKMTIFWPKGSSETVKLRLGQTMQLRSQLKSINLKKFQIKSVKPSESRRILRNLVSLLLDNKSSDRRTTRPASRLTHSLDN